MPDTTRTEKRLWLQARVAWIVFWTLVALPLLVAAAQGFAWSWPGMRDLFGGFFGDAYRLAGSWGRLYHIPLLWAGFAVLITQLRLYRHAPSASRRSGILLLRVGLFGLSLWGFAVAVEKLAFLTDAVVENPFFELPADDKAIRDTLLGQLGRVAAGTDFDAVILESLARGDVTHARIHVEAAALLGIPLQRGTQEAYAEATSWSATALRGSWDAMRGAITGQSDSLASFAGALAVDLTPAGDVRDIAYQLGVSQEPDELILGLSIFGLGLTAMAFIVPQQAVPVRSGKAALKTAVRFSKVSAGVGADIRRITTDTVDVPGFTRAARQLDFTPDMAVRFVRREGAEQLGRVSGDLYQIGQTANTGAALAVLKHADTLADLPFYKRIATAMGESTETVLTVLGKNSKHAFRVYRAGRHVKAAIGGSVAALLASLGGLLLSLSGSMTTTIVKQMTRRVLTSL